MTATALIKKTTGFNKLIGALFAVVALAGLSACDTVDMEEALRTAQTLDSAQLSPDIKLAASAVAMSMKGYGAGIIPGASYAPGADDGLREAGVNYDGFTVRGLNVLSYDILGTEVPAVQLSGILLFEDQIGRRAAVRFLTDYMISGGGIVISAAGVTPVYAVEPKIESYVVPYDPNVDPAAITADLNTLYTYAVTNAIDLNAPPPGTGDYDIYMFYMDRASDSSKQTGRISKTILQKDGFEGATTMLDYNGWMVGVISGQIDPMSAEPLYAKALHRPGDETLFILRFPRMIGLYGLTAGSADVATLDGATQVQIAAQP